MSGLVLMENAGRGCVDVLERLGIDGPVVILCGKGNNAGDGFVIARHLAIRGYECRVLLLCPPNEFTGDAATNCVVEAGCHAVEDGKSALRLEIVADNDIAGLDRNYNVVRRFLNCGSPETSPTLTKPLSGQDTHGGGDLFAPVSAQEDLFLAWFDI